MNLLDTIGNGRNGRGEMQRLRLTRYLLKRLYYLAFRLEIRPNHPRLAEAENIRAVRVLILI